MPAENDVWVFVDTSKAALCVVWMFYAPAHCVFLQFRKYAVPFLLCGREPLLDDEESDMVTTTEASNKVMPSWNVDTHPHTHTHTHTHRAYLSIFFVRTRQNVLTSKIVLTRKVGCQGWVHTSIAIQTYTNTHTHTCNNPLKSFLPDDLVCAFLSPFVKLWLQCLHVCEMFKCCGWKQNANECEQ